MPGPQTQHKGVVYGDDENAPKSQTGNRDSTRRSSTDGPGFAATPGVAARGPKTGAAVCVCGALFMSAQ